ncbi:argonaute/piwi family protein [Devosia sp.]|uniref:argonaute/piwi family protein n=1 Tax=Devosia sp. TaxID=1871048 RepID=UPI003F7278B5
MRNLTLNFAPLSLEGETSVQVGSQPYDAERLADLRNEFRTTHVFRRDGNLVLDVPIAASATPLGNVTQEVDLAKERKLWPGLMQATLLRNFAGQRDIYSDHPVTVIGSIKKGLIQHPSLPTWMQRRTSLQFEARTIFSSRDGATTGLIVETRTRNLILGNCAQLLDAGVVLLGKWVQIERPANDPRLMPRRKLIGRVRSISGDVLELDDHEEGFESIKASDAYLESRAETFDSCVMSILGPNGAGAVSVAERAAEEQNSGPGRKRQIEEALNYLRTTANLEAIPGVRFLIGEQLESGVKGFPQQDYLKKPVLVFDPAGNKTDDYAERGLIKHGPYDQRTHTPKKLRIVVICEARSEGQVDAFVAKFLDGMPNVLTGKNRTARYGDGFISRFRFEKPSVSYFTANGPSAASYLAASRAALEEARDANFKWDLALVQVEESFKELQPENNPYYATKSQFLKQGVPVQSVRIETMATPEQQLVFAMNHLSLATYAKLGGIPWLLAAQQRVAHELVIGLGSHTASASRIGSRQRYVGITTVFSSDGSYLLSDKTSAVPYDEYPEALFETVRRSITKVRTDDNWRSTDKVRLVFHVFKPLKDTEAEAIKRAVEHQGLSDVTFAFVHIAQDHPFVVFDNTQEGIGYGNVKKGVLGPSRGLHLKLGDFESLIVFSGASELKQASDGMPRPCLLKLHRLSTFSDMTYLARQAYEFAGNSWRMLAPEPFPITIRYSDLIAERLAGLGAVSGWDPDAIQFGQIGKTLWFL